MACSSALTEVTGPAVFFAIFTDDAKVVVFGYNLARVVETYCFSVSLKNISISSTVYFM